MANFKNENELRNIIIAIAIIMGFLFLVSFAIFYVRENYSAESCSVACSCKTSLPLIISLLSTLGVFVGTIMYYLLSGKFSREQKLMQAGINKTLNYLSKDEKAIVKALINNGGELSQSSLGKITAMNKVKTYRVISTLEKKAVVKKEKSGMTNKVILDNELKHIYIQK